MRRFDSGRNILGGDSIFAITLLNEYFKVDGRYDSSREKAKDYYG